MPISCSRCGTPHHGNKNNSKCNCCGSIIYGFERLQRKREKTIQRKREKAIDEYFKTNSPQDIQKKFDEYVKSRQQ